MAASSVCMQPTSTDNLGTRPASCLVADGRYPQRKPKTRFGGESVSTEETGRDASGKQADLWVSTASDMARPFQRCTAQTQDTRACKSITPVPSCPFWSSSAFTSYSPRLQATRDPPPLSDQPVRGSAPNSCDPDTRGESGSGKTHPLIPRGCADNQEQDASARAVPDVATSPGGEFSTGAGVEEARRSRQSPATRGVRPDGAGRKPHPFHISSKNGPSRGSDEFQVSVLTDTESSWEDVEEEARKETARRTPVHEGKAALLRTPTFRYAAVPKEARNVGLQSLLTSKEMSSGSGLSETMMCSAAIPGAGDVVKGQAMSGKWNGVGALLLRGPRSSGSTPATDHFFMSRFTVVSDFLGFGPSRQVLHRPALAGASLPPSSSPFWTDSGVASPTSSVPPQISFCLTPMPSSEGATEKKTAPVGTPKSKDAASVPSAASLLSHLSRACSVAASSASRLVVSGPLGVQSEWRKTDQNIISENPTGAVSSLNCSPRASDQGGDDDRVGPPIPASGMIALQQELLFLSASASGKQRLSSRRTRPRARRRAAVRDQSAETHSSFGRRRADSWNCSYVDSEANRRSGVSCGTVSAGHSSATGEAPSRESFIHIRPCTTMNISSCSPGDKGKRYSELASSITWRNAQRRRPLSDAGMDTSSLDSLDTASSSSRGTSNSGDSDASAETHRQRMPFPPFWPSQVEEDKERSVSCQVTIEGRSVDNTRVENEIGRPVVSWCSARANNREVYGHRTDGIQSTGLEARILDSTGVRVLPTMPSCGCGEILTSPTLNGCKAPPATGLQEENYGVPAFGGGSGRAAVCRQIRSSDGETTAIWLHRKKCLNTRINERVRAASDGKLPSGTVFSLAASRPLEEPESHCNQLESDGVKERCVHISRELNPQGTVYGDDTAMNNSARLGDQNESSAHLAGHRPPKDIKGSSNSGPSTSFFLPTQPLSKFPASCGEQQSRGNGPERKDFSKVQKPTAVQMWFCSDHFIYDFF
ncbi:hypothetical protein TGDOM2_286520 [Toxoplasma gondii GAB2-2007-GAL-DOM2]|nr:hypothetical protein TGVEG_286520 [Toxoplasma gondii VEG]KFG40139.1 hypothetical protein TGDOM2_286520 [Toxoplasma gondii GAB2-2007-GAL-DOM2]KFG44728.1 hypothetical protein TGP89_286520 [Toxoplasma gondii p89]